MSQTVHGRQADAPSKRRPVGELDERAAKLNEGRQAVIKTWLGQAMDQDLLILGESRPRSTPCRRGLAAVVKTFIPAWDLIGRFRCTCGSPSYPVGPVFAYFDAAILLAGCFLNSEDSLMNAHSRLSLTAALRSGDEIETVKSQGCPRSTTHRSVVLAAAPGDGQPWYDVDAAIPSDESETPQASRDRRRVRPAGVE